MIETVTFNTAENKLIVTFEDGTTKEYTQTDAAQYIADYPDRVSDVISMGWN
jgi:hypothetical protein